MKKQQNQIKKSHNNTETHTSPRIVLEKSRIPSTFVPLSCVRTFALWGLFVHLGEGVKGGRSVWLPALVFVDVQLFDLLLQEGNGHRAATVSVWQRVDLEHRKRVQQLHNEQGSTGWHALDLASASKVSPFSQGTRGRDGCGDSLSCPFFQASTLQGLSGWSDPTAPSRLCCFSTPRSLCSCPFRYFGGKRMSPPLNLNDCKTNQRAQFRNISGPANQTSRMMENGRTEAAALGPGFGRGRARAGPGWVFLFLRAFCSHLISTVPVTVDPAV